VRKQGVEKMDMDIQNDAATNNLTDNLPKTFAQEEVNSIVAAEKRRIEARHAEQLEALKSQQAQRNEEVPRNVDIDDISRQVEQKISAEIERRQLENEMSSIAMKYTSSLENGRRDYEDFDKITEDFDPQAMPQLTYLVAGLDNAADVLYEISKNPQKLATLDYLALRNPRKAQAEILKLSQSITENRKALNDAAETQTRQPLDRLSNSRAQADSGEMGIQDFRKQSWLR